MEEPTILDGFRLTFTQEAMLVTLTALRRCPGCQHDFLLPTLQRFFFADTAAHMTTCVHSSKEGWTHPDTFDYLHMNFSHLCSMKLMEHISLIFHFRPYRPTTRDLPRFAHPAGPYYRPPGGPLSSNLAVVFGFRGCGFFVFRSNIDFYGSTKMFINL